MMSSKCEYAIVEVVKEQVGGVIDTWIKRGFELVSHAVYYLPLPREKPLQIPPPAPRMVITYSLIFRRGAM